MVMLKYWMIQAEGDQISTRFTSTLSKKTGQKRQVTSDRSNPVKFDTPPYLYNEPSEEPPEKKDTNVSKEKSGEEVSTLVGSDEGDFLEFWLPCLKKKAKPAALTAWKRMRKEKRTDLTATKLVELYNKAAEISIAEKGTKQFVPYPSSWINNDQWNDEIEEPPKKFPFTLPQMEEGGYSGAIYPDLRGQRFYMEPREGGKVFDEQGNELNLIESDGEGYVAPRLCGTR